MSNSPSIPPSDALNKLRIDRSSTEESKSNRKFLWGLLLLFGLGAGGAYAAVSVKRGQEAKGGNESFFSVPDAIRSRPEVRWIRATMETGRSADATVVATGYLESRRQAKIGARAPGRIEVVHVEEGSRVSKNQILAVLEHADLDASLAATEASLERTKAALEEQQILIAQNNREFDRMKKLLATKSISDTEHDQARFQYESSVARLKSMKADVQLAEAKLREAQQLRENMSIRAPFDGTVISKDAEVGESILPGGMGEASGRGSVVTIADLDHLEVDCDVKEDYIGRVASDQSAEVQVDAVPGRRYHGLVRKVIPMGDRARATIKVKVAIVDVDGRLFPNMSCTVYFLPTDSAESLPSDQPRMFLPSDCLVEEANEFFVWVIDEKTHAVKKTVTLGVQKEGRVEILDGISKGDKIVVKPPKLEMNQPVKVTN